MDIALNCLDLLDSVAVSGSNEGVVRLWDTGSGKMRQRLDWSEFGAVNSVKLMAGDGVELLLLSGHDDGQLVVSSVRQQAVNTLKILNHHDNILWSIDISSKFITTCSEDSRVAVYNREEIATSQSPRYSLSAHSEAVTCVSLSDHVVTSGSRDRTVIVWSLCPDSSHYQVLAVLRGHQEILHYVTQDDQRIYSSDDNGELFVWDKKAVLERGEGGEFGEEMVLRRVDYGEERGAIDCILVRGNSARSHDTGQ